MTMKDSVAIAIGSKIDVMKRGARGPRVTAIDCRADVMASEVVVMEFGVRCLVAIRMGMLETIAVDGVALKKGASSQLAEQVIQVIQAITGVKKLQA